MSKQTDQVLGSLTREKRKQLLAVACASDLLAWVKACRPAPPRNPMAQIASEAISYIEPFTYLLPRRIGKWVRGATFFTSIGRQFGLISR